MWEMQDTSECNRVNSPLNHRRKFEGLLWPSPDHCGILTTPCTLHPCPGCSPVRKHKKKKLHINNRTGNINKSIIKYEQYLTTAFLVFCLIGFSLDAHRGETMSLSVFFLSTLGLAAGGFNSLLWGSWNSAAGIFSLYESELEGRLWCMWCWLWWGFAPWPMGLSVQELWTPKGPLPLWKLPLLLWALLSAGLCPDAEKEKEILVKASAGWLLIILNPVIHIQFYKGGWSLYQPLYLRDTSANNKG